MKFTVPSIRRGQRMSAEVVENLADGISIVNLNGDLLRIRNTTGSEFKVGQNIRLEVTGINPLTFKIATAFQPRLDKSV